MIKGAPVKTEARAIPGASATTEVQNNILLAAPDPADASVVLLCRSSCMILLPLELCPEQTSPRLNASAGRQVYSWAMKQG